jgi:methyl-accepting chemotaxis protein
MVVIDWFIGESLRGDRRTLMQARMLMAVLFTGMVMVPLMAVMYAQLGQTELAWFECGFFVGVVALAFLLRGTGALTVVGHLTLAVIGIGFAWPAFKLGGLHSAAALWMMGYPLIAFLVLGRVGALWCFAMMIVAGVLGSAGEAAGAASDGGHTLFSVLFICVLIALSVVSFLFETANASGYTALEDERRNAEGLAGQVSRLLADVTAALSSADREGRAIAQNADQIAGSMVRQVAQASEVNSRMTTLHRRIADNAEMSIHAAEAAGTAGERATQGGKVMTEAINDMRRVSDMVAEAAVKIEELTRRSDEISNIVGVIREIADQTNLLALNAAIEAARAGEQGRGFAVVADEVRKLAERTQSSTGEIGERVSSILGVTQQAMQSMTQATDLMQKGRDNAVRADAVLQDIIASTGDVAATLRTVAASQQEQTEANAQMAEKIAAIGDAIQGAHQSTAEIAGATKRLEQNIGALSSTASAFSQSG